MMLSNLPSTKDNYSWFGGNLAFTIQLPIIKTCTPVGLATKANPCP